MNINKKSLLHTLELRIRFLKKNSGSKDVIEELEYLIKCINDGDHNIKVWQ